MRESNDRHAQGAFAALRRWHIGYLYSKAVRRVMPPGPWVIVGAVAALALPHDHSQQPTRVAFGLVCPACRG